MAGSQRRTIRVERPRDQRLKEPHTPAAVRSNGWLDDPRTEPGTTGLWNLDRPINPERTGRGWPGTPQSRSGVEHARGSMTGGQAGCFHNSVCRAVRAYAPLRQREPTPGPLITPPPPKG
jgi:hypothetical protein